MRSRRERDRKIKKRGKTSQQLFKTILIVFKRKRVIGKWAGL